MDLEEKIEYHKQEAEKEYERWRKTWDITGGSIQTHNRVAYYARMSLIAELERKLIGTEKNKLQQRIGRQRKANRELQARIKQLEEALDRSYEQMEQEIAHLKEQLASTTWRASLPHEAYNKEVGSE